MTAQEELDVLERDLRLHCDEALGLNDGSKSYATKLAHFLKSDEWAQQHQAAIETVRAQIHE